MTNKELEVIVCNAIDARKEQGTPFDRDAFVALVKMAQAYRRNFGTAFRSVNNE